MFISYTFHQKVIGCYNLLQGNSPEALKLAKEIDDNLGQLGKLVDAAISREVTAGTRLPAATTGGQYEQALLWIDDPRSAENVIGMLVCLCFNM